MINNEVVTIDTNNFNAMAKAMGISNERSEVTDSKKASTLARVRLNHKPVMGAVEVNGKPINAETLSGGSYKVEVPNGPTYLGKSAIIRPFMQRFMHKRFIPAVGNGKANYNKTIMADSLNIDLKDNFGGFNCGKPSGWIEDFKALPKAQQDLIKSCKRVRVIFGTIELVEPHDETGKPIDLLEPMPFIWEVDNRDAFKIFGKAFSDLAKAKRLPPQHTMICTSEEVKDASFQYYLPQVKLDLTKTIELDDADQEMFADLMLWVQNYNEYILNEWSTNMNKHDETDKDLVDDFIDIESEELV